jgi:polar amino acid transport system permease protein
VTEVIDYLGPLSAGIGHTLLVTGASFAIGLLLGLPLVAMRRSGWLPARALAVGFVELTRGIPPIAWLFLLYYGLSQLGVRIDSLVAAIAGLGVISAAYMSEIYRGALRAVPRGQFEAARSVGLSRAQVYRFVIVPQVVVTALPPAATYAIGLLKDSAIASVIGVPEVTALAFNETQQDFRGLSIFAAAGLIYLAMSVPLAVIARGLGARLDRRLAHV